MIDTHCHFDMLENPFEYIRRKDREGDIVIGMTNCPNHYISGAQHVKSFSRVRLALGFHPQIVEQIIDQLPLFEKLVDTTSYIGEIGLDYSNSNIASLKSQNLIFDRICQLLSRRKKVISIHSTKADDDIIQYIEKYQLNTVILHWYSGKIKNINKAIELGCYFSINEAMSLSKHGQKILGYIPADRLLTETDIPFNQRNSILNALRNTGITEFQIEQNFKNLLNTIMS